MDTHVYISSPAPFAPLTKETEKQCKIHLPKDDNETLKRQACMFSASGDLICDDKRRDGQGMIVREACSRPPVGYSQ